MNIGLGGPEWIGSRLSKRSPTDHTTAVVAPGFGSALRETDRSFSSQVVIARLVSLLVPARRLRRRPALMAVGGCCAAVLAFAQPRAGDEIGQPVVQAFAARDYDADPQVWGGVTDDAGFVYLGNKGCVLEYDGAVWRRIPIGNTVYVRALARAPDGRIYVGGVDELGYLASDAFGRKTFVSLRDRLPPEDRALGAIWTIKVGADGVYFAAGSRVIRWHEERFEVWREADARVFQRIGGPDHEGHVLVKLDGRPLERFVGNRREEVSGDAALRPIALMAAWPMGEDLLVVSANHGLWRVARDGRAEPWRTEVDGLLGTVRSAAPLPSGGLVLGTADRGLVELSADGRFVRQVGRAEGLRDNLARLGPIDRAGALWVGTNHGAARVLLDGPRTHFGAGAGLGDVAVHEIVRHRGDLVVASSAGLFRLKAREPGQLANARFEPVPGAPTELCFAVASTPAGLLVATNDRLWFLRDSTARLEPVAGSPTVLGLTSSQAEHQVWWGVSGSGGGLLRLEWRDEAWQVTRPHAGLAESLHSVAEDRHGDLWLAMATRGIWRVEFDPAPTPGGERPVRRVTKLTAGQGLPDPHGEVSVQEGEDGEIAFAVGDARWRFNRATGQPEPADAGPISPYWTAALGRAQLHGTSALAEEHVYWLAGDEGVERFVPAGANDPSPPAARLLGVTGRPGFTWPAAGRLAADQRNLIFEFAPLPTVQPAEFQTQLRGYDEAWSKPGRALTRVYTNLPAGAYTFAARARDGQGRWGPEATLAFTIAPAWWATWWARGAAAAALMAAVVGFVRWRVRALRRRNRELQAIIAARTAELQASRDAAEAANRAKSTFLAHMSHELRTPLNGILAYAQLLRREAALPEAQRARAGVIVRSGEHLLALINEVLDLAKVEAGRVARHESDCDLAASVAGVAELMRVRAEAKGLVWRVTIDPDLPAAVRTDEQKLRQVLLNLIGNAVKFTERGEVELVVRARAPSGESRPPFGSRTPFGTATVEFTVRDTGPGMPAESLAGKSSASGASLEHPAAGAGLGLALSQRFLELLGSRLHVASEVGQGTTCRFELTLPITPRPARVDDAVSFVSGYAGPARHALVVDDDEASRQGLAELLASVGFTVDSAGTGEAALARFRTRRPDLVLLDLRLAGGESGLVIARRLRAEPEGTHVRIVAVSASAFPTDREAALAAGCTDFLAKPFTETQLWTVIGGVLDLTWQLGVAQPVSPDTTALPLPEDLVSALQGLAAQGDVTGLRAALDEARRKHPAQAAFLAGLEQLAATYDLERVSARLATVAKGAKTHG